MKIELIRGRGGDFPDMRITQYPGEGLKCSYVKSRKDMINHSEIQRIGPFKYWKEIAGIERTFQKVNTCTDDGLFNRKIVKKRNERFEFHSSFFLFSVKYKKQKAVLILLSTNCVVLEIPVIALYGIWWCYQKYLLYISNTTWDLL